MGRPSHIHNYAIYRQQYVTSYYVTMTLSPMTIVLKTNIFRIYFYMYSKLAAWIKSLLLHNFSI